MRSPRLFFSCYNLVQSCQTVGQRRKDAFRFARLRGLEWQRRHDVFRFARLRGLEWQRRHDVFRFARFRGLECQMHGPGYRT